MTALKSSLVAACVALAACNGDKTSGPKIDVFAAVPATIAAGQSATLVWGTSGTVNSLSLSPGGTVTGNTLVVTPAATTTYTLTATGGGATVTASTVVTVSGTVPTNVVRFDVSLPAAATAGTAASATVKAVDGSGSTVTAYTGTAHFTSDDANAVLPADVTFNAAAAGSAAVSVTFKTAGGRSLLVSDGSIAGFAKTAVAPGPAKHIAISKLPATASTGQALPLRASLTDDFGNVATTYTGTLHFSSNDGAAALPADTAFTSADAGARDFSVTFNTAGAAQTVTAGDGTLTATSAPVNVTAPVVAGPTAAAVVIEFPSAVTAGVEREGTATVVDSDGNPATGYTGTLHFASSDGNESVLLPADLTFTAGQATQDIHATLITAGTQTLTAADAAHSAITGSTSITVMGASPTNTCTVAVVGLAPVTAPPTVAQRRRAEGAGLTLPVPAGTILPVEVTQFDSYGNVATGSDDEVKVETDDESAIVSGHVIFTAGEPAQHDFSVQFHTANPTGWQLGASDLTRDSGCTQQGLYPVTHGPAALLLARFSGCQDGNCQPGAAVMAGSNVELGMEAVDAYYNEVDDATDSVSISAPNDHTIQSYSVDLTGGLGFTVVTFDTVGPQYLDLRTAYSFTRVGPLTVHGFVYTQPPFTSPLVISEVASATASRMKLDFSTTNGGEVTLFSAGYNLPINGGVDSVTIEPSDLNVGTGAQAIVAAIVDGPNGSVILAGASQKRAGAGAKADDTNLSDGEAAFIVTLTLSADATYPMVVFDGAKLGPGFRAGARDHLGNEVVRSWEVGIGKLEIR